MKTVQVVLDETLLRDSDRLAKTKGINRSMLVREALTEYLARNRTRELEERDRAGYAQTPVEPGEFDVWDREAECLPD